LSRNSMPFVEPEVLLPGLQDPITGPYHELLESRPQTHTLFL